MTTPPHSKPKPIDAQSDQRPCPGCPQAHECRSAWGAEPVRPGPFSPVGLSLAGAVVFLLPLVLAIVAGAIARQYSSAAAAFSIWQIIAVLTGMFAGILIARLVMPLITKRFGDCRG